MGSAIYLSGTLYDDTGVVGPYPTVADAETYLVATYGTVRELPNLPPGNATHWLTGSDAVEHVSAELVTNPTPAQLAGADQILAQSSPYVDWLGTTVSSAILLYNTSNNVSGPNAKEVTIVDAYRIAHSLAFGTAGPAYIAAERKMGRDLVDAFRTMQGGVNLATGELLLTALEPSLSAASAGLLGLAWQRWQAVSGTLTIPPADIATIDNMFIEHFKCWPRDLS